MDGATGRPVMICAPLAAESAEEMVEDMHKAKAQGADVAELRLDAIRKLCPGRDLRDVLARKPLPVIVVCRPKWEGGHYEGDESSRVQTLLRAMELGADYVDFELKVACGHHWQQVMNSRSGRKIIVSHNINGVTPSVEDLNHLVSQMQATGADIIKIVTNAANITESARIFHVLSHSEVPLVAYSAGERGLISQLLCPKYGGLLVYGSMEGKPVPGLTTLNSLRDVYKIECINADTKVFGLISKPVCHSKGPLLHNPSFRHVKYNGTYLPMFVDDLEEFFSIYSVHNFSGFSVGFPYKEAIVRFCDEVHPLAQSIGAVNTIIRRPRDGKLVGYNTDCEAAITAIEDALLEQKLITKEKTSGSPLAQRQFVLVGAGGAGRALAFGAKSRRARVVIFDIDFGRAESLARSVSGEARPYKDLTSFQPEKGAILANATPLGMTPNTDRIPVAEETLGDYQLVFDCVYTPRKTRLLKDAEVAGAIIVSGIEMFLRQAISQFSLFTGRHAPVEFMREIVLEKF